MFGTHEKEDGGRNAKPFVYHVSGQLLNVPHLPSHFQAARGTIGTLQKVCVKTSGQLLNCPHPTNTGQPTPALFRLRTFLLDLTFVRGIDIGSHGGFEWLIDIGLRLRGGRVCPLRKLTKSTRAWSRSKRFLLQNSFAELRK